MTSTARTEYQNLLVSIDGPAARIVLNRPDKRNALSLELIEEMMAALGEEIGRASCRERV